MGERRKMKLFVQAQKSYFKPGQQAEYPIPCTKRRSTTTKQRPNSTQNTEYLKVNRQQRMTSLICQPIICFFGMLAV